MTVEMKDVLEALDPEEPDYVHAAKLGTAALPHIEKLVRSSDVNLASKATYLAGMIQDQRSSILLEAAALNQDPRIRVAAAFTVRNLVQFDVNRILQKLVKDRDSGVRRIALKSVRHTICYIPQITYIAPVV